MVESHVQFGSNQSLGGYPDNRNQTGEQGGGADAEPAF